MHERWEEQDVKESAGNMMTTIDVRRRGARAGGGGEGRGGGRRRQRGGGLARSAKESAGNMMTTIDVRRRGARAGGGGEGRGGGRRRQRGGGLARSARSCRSCTSGGMWRQRRKCGYRAATTSPRTKGSRDRGQGRTWAGHDGAWGKRGGRGEKREESARGLNALHGSAEVRGALLRCVLCYLLLMLMRPL